MIALLGSVFVAGVAAGAGGLVWFRRELTIYRSAQHPLAGLRGGPES